MQIATLKATLREKTGKEYSKKLRNNGLIPANIHGGEKALPLQLDSKSLLNILSKSSSEHPIVQIDIDDSKKATHAILKELQRDPVHDTIIHADFMQIDMTKKIRVTVPVELAGKSKGVVEEGGIINLIHRELEIESLPGAIPEKIVVDITELGLNHTIHVSGITTGEDFKIIDDGTTAIVSVVAPREEVVEQPEEVPVEGEAAPAGEQQPEAKPTGTEEKTSKE